MAVVPVPAQVDGDAAAVRVRGTVTGQLATTARSAYLPTLDGWRAIAVALVVLCHLAEGQAPWRDASGDLGVSIFFGISGYLICTRLLDEDRSRGRISLRRLYLRRAFRILPPAFAYLTAITLLALLGVFHLSLLEVAAAALFFRNYVPGNWDSSHFWSLAVEEHF